MATHHDSATSDERSAVEGPPSWSDVATRPLTVGVLLMTAAGGATGFALLSYGLAEQGRGSMLRRFAEAVFGYESALYGMAVAFLLVSVLFLVMRDDRAAPLTYGLLSIGVLLIIPFAALVLDVAPWVFGGRLTSGSATQLTLIFGPLVALGGWLVTAYAVVADGRGGLRKRGLT